MHTNKGRAPPVEHMNHPISGIIPPLVTPFRSDGTIDEAALRSETAYLVGTAKVHGLAVCGSTGEGHTLSTSETRLITRIVTEEAAGQVPIITGIIANSTDTVIARGKSVEDVVDPGAWHGKMKRFYLDRSKNNGQARFY